MKLSTKEIVLCSLFAAIISILAQISIPLPFTTVPLTLLVFGVSLTGLVLGSRLSFISVSIYLLLGAIGMPVFANFQAGFSVLFGPTGGYLLGLPLMVYIIGHFKDSYNSNIMVSLGLILGLVVVYITGTMMFSVITGNTIMQSISYCVAPFVLVDILKLVLAYTVSISVSKRMSFGVASN